MMLWSILTLMLGAVVSILVFPLLRRSSAKASNSGKQSEARVYRDQLSELERDVASGAVDGKEAESMRIEIQRRLLAVDDNTAVSTWQFDDQGNNLTVVAVASVIVAGSVGLYAVVGKPRLPSAPAMRTAGTTAAPQPNTASGQVGAGAVDEMIRRIVARVEANPEDGESWRMLGWSYFATERFDKAATAYATAVKLKPTAGALRAMYGEALVRAAGGQVTSEAAKVFKATLRHDAREPRARFFIGLAKEQAGNKKAALEDWLKLLSDAGSEDDWADDLRQRIIELASETGIDVMARLPAGTATGESSKEVAAYPSTQQPQQVAGTTGSRMPGPTAEDVRAAESMSTADRDAMIRGMVDRLQRRLEAAPRDAEGWIRLVRSRMVMGDTDKAAAALDRALQVFADATIERAKIEAAARDLGVRR